MKNEQCLVPSEVPTRFMVPTYAQKRKRASHEPCKLQRGLSMLLPLLWGEGRVTDFLHSGERAGVRASVHLPFLPANAAPAMTQAISEFSRDANRLSLSPSDPFRGRGEGSSFSQFGAPGGTCTRSSRRQRVAFLFSYGSEMVGGAGNAPVVTSESCL